VSTPSWSTSIGYPFSEAGFSCVTKNKHHCAWVSLVHN